MAPKTKICPPGKELNIETGLCRKKCEPDQVRNPKTGRCVSAKTKTKSPPKSKSPPKPPTKTKSPPKPKQKSPIEKVKVKQSLEFTTVIERIKTLLKELDNLVSYERKSEIEGELHSLRESFHNNQINNMPISDNQLTSYPEIDDLDFFEKLLNKKEFVKSLYPPIDINKSYDELYEEKCSTTNELFRLTKNQIFVKNFLSPKTNYNGLLLFHGVGVGKCHAINTPIMMHSGYIKYVQDIVVGDYLMGDDSLPRKVTSLGRGHDQMYDVIFEGGQQYCVNSEHILCLKSGPTDSDVLEISVKDFMRLDEYWRNSFYGYHVLTHFKDEYLDMNVCDMISWDMKEIPVKALINSVETRRELLRNIIITFGNEDNDLINLVNHSFLIPDIYFLVRSLAMNLIEHREKRGYFRIIGLNTYKHFMVSKLIGIYPQNAINNYYGFTLDGNHRYLLGDCTVTHNTCAAISIAEQFKHQNKIMVLCPTSLKDNFKRQLFDINNLNSCTSQTYLEKIPDHSILSKEEIEKRVNRIITTHYQFWGFLEFANKIEQMEKRINDLEKRPKIAEIKFITKIKEEFSNRVIIIDEAHNMRQEDDSTSKKLPPYLLKILEHGENNKLIMMTATPMFNGVQEIVWLINFLLANDKKPLLNISMIFDEDENIKKQGIVLLKKNIKGYVSYMRGDNPFSFPLRLFANVNANTNIMNRSQIPIYSIKNELIPEDERLDKIVPKLVASTMSDYQTSFDHDLDREDEDNNSKLLQLSNITYPYADAPSGQAGFERCFQKKGTGANLKLSYKADCVKQHGYFLSNTGIAKFAPKLKDIVDTILSSEGIVFVYSYYIYSALLPIAIALEHAGYTRYGTGNTLLNLNVAQSGKNSYIILSRNADFPVDFNKVVPIIRSKENMNGNIVKVILGTSVTAEGIDFKNIRQIHIVEPWYHLNKIEQVIGRAVRNCSHIMLPIEKRNVTIYQHVNINKTNVESIDLRVYRIAEKKQKTISFVEQLLIENSVDCLLNYNNMYYDKIKLNMMQNIVTSQNKKIKYSIGDDPDIVQAAVKCTAQPLKEIDNSTFHPSFYTDEFAIYTHYIVNAYKLKNKHSYTYAELLKELSTTLASFDEDVLKFALDNMITNRIVFENNKAVKGFIVQYGDKYMFQPLFAPKSRITMASRKEYEPKQIKNIKFDETFKTQKVIPNKGDVINSLDEEIKNLEANTLMNNAEYCKRFNKYLVDYVVDRMTFEKQVQLCNEVVVTKEFFELFERNIYIKSLIADDRIIKTPNNTYYLVNIFNTEEKLHIIKNGKLTECNPHEISIFNSMDKPYKEKEDKILKSFKGFMTLKGTFKIFSEQGGASGTVCGTGKISQEKYMEMIRDYDKDILDIFEDGIPKKAIKCNLYELVLRAHMPKIFARPHYASRCKTK